MEELTRLCKTCNQTFPITEFKRIHLLYRGRKCRLCRNTQERARHLKSGRVKVTRAEQRPFSHPELGLVKRCPVCKVVKPTDEFKVDKGKPTVCRPCLRERKRTAYWQDPEHRRQHVRNYMVQNRDGINRRQRARRNANREKARQQSRETYQRRRLSKIEYQKRHRASMTPAERERIKILARPVKVAHQNKRRALKAGVPSEKVHLKDILKRDGPTCYLCGKVLNPKVKREISLDHVIPLTKGGPHTAANIRIACLPCNIRKGNRSLEEFRELQHLTSHTGLY